MLETIKIVNGVEISRNKGSKYPYFVCFTGRAWEIGKGTYSFRTCKAAAEFIEHRKDYNL